MNPDTSHRAPTVSGKAWIALFLIAGFAVRGFFYLQARNVEIVHTLGLDAQYYHEWARALARGNWTLDEPYFQGPLYPYLLAALYKIFGAEPTVARVAQMVLGAGTTALAFWVGDRAVNRATGILATPCFSKTTSWPRRCFCSCS